MTQDVKAIIAGLIEMERERITGWKGPPGAAYNAISESLFERGLLTSKWTLTELGRQARAAIAKATGEQHEH